MARWVTVQTLRGGWYRFWQDSRQVPPGVWRRWWGTLALGLGLCAVVTLGLTVWAKGYADRGLQAWDARLLPLLADGLPLNFSRSITWESPGNLLGMLPVVGGFVGIMVARSQPLLAAAMATAYGLQFPLVWIGWGYWNRGRPDAIAGGVAASGLHSFPSGHTVVVITVYGLLAYLWCRASRSGLERLLIALVVTLWIGLILSSRLVLGAHWPSDVLVGMVIGGLWLTAVIVALGRVEEGWRKPQ
ncbi:phosphatase PAP2 family protein [Nodosilinea sp. PGN35]|uniref:phosphatase PAP2 family protein n=1 Tax=Nodosilinea sp. PGN35 TaxID=3020489 RepID=UPI0023B26CD5|nr:phosphatase PAP2 family protein [Nodosilinea sp. TSF1-S3]MDF0364800.1 phosphatase PAP2 family protein [Nodosilinea sp. TSF1-S3]